VCQEKRLYVCHFRYAGIIGIPIICRRKDAKYGLQGDDMLLTQTLMEVEAREASKRIAEQFQNNSEVVKKIGVQLRKRPPKYVVMIGRGSSDHVGVFAKYLIEIECGIPVAPASPSVQTIYGKNVCMSDALVIVVSQSGRSPDIIRQLKSAKESGAYCIGLVNDETAPLIDYVDEVLPLNAGAELSVAATKSYLASLAALLHLVSEWKNNGNLAADIKGLPNLLAEVLKIEPQLLPADCYGVSHCVVLGRGFGYAIAREMALKFKEVCGIHAEAFSSAEFLHGPVTLIANNLKIMDVQVFDESTISHENQMSDLKARGADICRLFKNDMILPHRLAPLVIMQRFYVDIAAVSVSLGCNPDAPEGLKKVTQTI